VWHESLLAVAPELLSAVDSEMPLQPPSALRLLAGGILCGLSLSLLSAEEVAETKENKGSKAPPIVSAMKEDVLRMQEFFDTTLPGTLSQYNVVMDFSPKFSDLRDNEYVRYPVEFRYGLKPRWELLAGITPFSPNPINSGFDHRWGLGEVRAGVRHDAGAIPWLYDATTLGFLVRLPLGRPPIELNDHYIHLHPSISASRHLPWPDATFLTEFSYDRQVADDLNAPPVGVIHQDISEVAPGILYKPGEFGGFFNYAFRYYDQSAGSHLGHEAKLGGIWDVPIARTAKWGLPGKWQIELAYRYTTEEGIGHSQGVTARVHWKTTLREILNQSSK
jgi:hypothetical protein